MDMDRLKLLEQQFAVMQQEINEVLGEVQMAMQGLARGNKMALEVILLRLDALEGGKQPELPEIKTEGVEL